MSSVMEFNGVQYMGDDRVMYLEDYVTSLSKHIQSLSNRIIKLETIGAIKNETEYKREKVIGH